MRVQATFVFVSVVVVVIIVILFSCLVPLFLFCLHREVINFRLVFGALNLVLHPLLLLSLPLFLSLSVSCCSLSIYVLISVHRR